MMMMMMATVMMLIRLINFGVPEPPVRAKKINISPPPFSFGFAAHHTTNKRRTHAHTHARFRDQRGGKASLFDAAFDAVVY
uniref:Putative secreted protein n=1 Tax=Anopheles darlingi TaxID=43151 RepID=A0A2M4DGT4_ANODA